MLLKYIQIPKFNQMKRKTNHNLDFKLNQIKEKNTINKRLEDYNLMGYHQLEEDIEFTNISIDTQSEDNSIDGEFVHF